MSNCKKCFYEMFGSEIRDRLKEKICMALGEASMCWDETPKGVFDSSKCLDIGVRLYSDIAAEIVLFLKNKLD